MSGIAYRAAGLPLLIASMSLHVDMMMCQRQPIAILEKEAVGGKARV
jgi:hypothetical protein